MSFHVAIVGAGLAGPALALALAKVEGVSSTIFELRHEGFEQGQHISLAPNALRVLNNLGVLGKLQAIGNSYEELHFRNAQGGIIATFHNGNESDYGFKAMRIHRRHVQQILVEECLTQGINIRHGMKLISIQEGKDTAQLTFENGETAQAHLVVGADGLHSPVREHVVPQAKSVYAQMLGVTGFLDRKDLHPSVTEIVLPSHFVGQDGFIAVMPSNKSGEEIGFFSTMPFPEEKSRQEWGELFGNKEAIRKILTDTFSKENGWHEAIDSITKTAKNDTLCSWPFYVAPWLNMWTSPGYRSLVLGDAAHAMIPTGGLGASLAFEDAECLAIAIEHMRPFNSAEKRAETLNTWQAHRKVRLNLVQAFTNRNKRLRQPAGSWAVQIFKEWFVWAFIKVFGPGGAAQDIYKYESGAFKEILLNN